MIDKDLEWKQDRLVKWCENVVRPPVFARGGDGPARKRGQIPNRQLKQGQVWKKLKEAFQDIYLNGHIVRVENSVGARGMPDVYYRINRQLSGWIEIKTGHQKPTDLQLAWHENERLAGGMVWVLTIRPECAILDNGKGPMNLGVCHWIEIVSKL